MRYELVIFDNDGVLVDSEPISNTILAEYLTELGHPTSYQESLRDYMGAAVHRVHDLVEERTGEKLPADFDETLHSRIFAAFEQELEPVAGVEDVLGKLVADGIPYCVASSGNHERIRVGHRKTGLDQWFEEEWIFSAEDVGRESRRPTCSCAPPSGWAYLPSVASSSRTARSEWRRPRPPGWMCTGLRR